MMDDSALAADAPQEEVAADSAAPSDAATPAEEAQEPQEDTVAVQEVVISSQQFDSLLGGFKACATISLVSLVLAAFVLGSVLYSHLVRGWRA